jgi:hypothetical protein
MTSRFDGERRGGLSGTVRAIGWKAVDACRRPARQPALAPDADVEITGAIVTLSRTPIAELQARGYHFERRDYYSPINDLSFLDSNRDLWQGRPLPAGIDWGLDQQLELLRRVTVHVPELADVPLDLPVGCSPSTYHWNNDFWRGTDAILHYALLRYLRPARIVEIGCGWSSLLMARALARNQQDGVKPTSVHQIEPYPRRELLSELPSDWTREEMILQRASLESIEALDDDDILFYDGSHVSRAASDVNWFFFEVLPRVQTGVWVHLHDIFWPSDYPESWVFERGQTWNEQYVLQAFLMFNREFEIVLANSALLVECAVEAKALLSGTLEEVGPGGSVWIRRRAP